MNGTGVVWSVDYAVARGKLVAVVQPPDLAERVAGGGLVAHLLGALGEVAMRGALRQVGGAAHAVGGPHPED